MKQSLAIPTLLATLPGVMIAVPAFASSDRDQTQAHYQRGDELDNMGKYEEAIEEFRKALWLNRNHFESHNNLGFVFSKLGRYWEAIRIDPDLELPLQQPRICL